MTAVDWWAASRALRGERESGDRYLVSTMPAGALFAVVDGIGHGSEAAAAAEVALRVLRNHADMPIPQLVELCHDALRETRGVVASVARFDHENHALTWIGVGNVEGVVLRPGTNGARTQARLLPGRGVLGGRLPALHDATLDIRPGDTLLFATDGIDPDFDFHVDLHPSPSARRLAEQILVRHAHDNDDALVLVARFGPRGS